MKVTVCFGNIRVVVPCGSGDLSVFNLQDKACARYKKAIAKAPNYYVRINQLESSVDGGILDADDLVRDVVEDKEKLIANFEEEDSFHDLSIKSVPLSDDNNVLHRSSITPRRTAPSEQKQSHLTSENEKLFLPFHRKEDSLEIDVNAETLQSNTRVVVRKENGLSKPSHYKAAKSPSKKEPIRSNGSIYDPRSQLPASYKIPLKAQSSSSSSKSSDDRKMNSKEQSFFRRDLATRQSMGSGLSETLDDLPVAYTIPIDDHFVPPTYNKKSNGSDKYSTLPNGNLEPSNLPWFYRDSQEVKIVNNGNIKAIKVGSFVDRQSNKFAGLLVRSIDQISRRGADELLMPEDVIVEINEHMLMDFAFEDAEAMLVESLNYPHVQFRILPVEERERRTSLGSSTSSNNHPSIAVTHPTPPAPPGSGRQTNHMDSSTASASSLSTQNSHSPLSKTPVNQLVADTVGRYTKKIGSRINIQLKKDIQGLGFTLTSRDTTIGGPGPIYVKQILPSGAAIKHGKLQAGDRLLEINGESVINQTQVEVVSTLRSIAIGSVVNFTISRQSENLPRKIIDDPDADKMMSGDHLKEYFVFEIPLNDTGSAGLGISLKGNQSTKTGMDLGIFVRNVIRGGAAWQDGRLQANDQLIKVNGHSLRGLSNRMAIDLLTNSMLTEGNMRGMIEMVITRRRKDSDTTTSQVSSEASGDMSDVIIDHLSLDKVRKRCAWKATTSTTFSTHSITTPRVSRQLFPGSYCNSCFKSFANRPIHPPPYCPQVDSASVRKRSWNPPRRSASFGGTTGRSRSRPLSSLHTPTPNKYYLNRRSRDEFIPANGSQVDQTPRHANDIISKSDERKHQTSVSTTETDHDDVDLYNNPDIIICDDEDILSDDFDHFSRESTLRQSISEKRKDPVPKLPHQNDSAKKKDKKKAKRDHKKDIRTNGKIVKSPIQHIKPPTHVLGNVQMNNNNSSLYTWKVPQSRAIRKSASTESLLDTGQSEMTREKHASLQIEEIDVGPSLGIAKSSSLESLQTAMESYKQNNAQLPMPRPLCKVVRGRVLNDSFRAALDQTNDVTKDLPSPRLHALQEVDYHAHSADDPTKLLKKRSKIRDIFKGQKPKKSDEETRDKKFSENELHKKSLETRREKDIEKMKAENERIKAKTKELRQKHTRDQHRDKTKKHENSNPPPVVPSSLYKLEDFNAKAKISDSPSERHFNQPTTIPSSGHYIIHKSHSTKVDGNPQIPPPVPKHHKRNKSEKYREASTVYRSLPRPPRRETCEVSPHPIIKVTSTNDRNSFSKLDNLAFYNRHKPSSVKKHSSDSSLISKGGSNIDNEKSATPRNRSENSASIVQTHRERTSRSEQRAGKNLHTSSSTTSFYQREDSPVAPPQSFYVVQEKKDVPGSVVVRRGVVNPKSPHQGGTTPPNYRHSIFTDQPSSFPYHIAAHGAPSVSPFHNSITPPHLNISDHSWMQHRSDDSHGSGSADNSRFISTPDSEIADRNRRAYQKLMHGPKFDGVLEKIEVSLPYNL